MTTKAKIDKQQIPADLIIRSTVPLSNQFTHIELNKTEISSSKSFEQETLDDMSEAATKVAKTLFLEVDGSKSRVGDNYILP